MFQPVARTRHIAAVTALLVVLAGCSTLKFPGVHRIVVQQGNVITKAMIDKLKPGMSKNQVRFVMGNAVLVDPFNENRWDYIYTADFRGEEYDQHLLSLFFDTEGRYTHYEGDFFDYSEATRE